MEDYRSFQEDLELRNITIPIEIEKKAINGINRYGRIT